MSLGENREFRSQQRLVWPNSVWNNLPLLTDSVVHKTETATHLLPKPSLNHVLHLRFSQQIILPMHSGILQKHHIGLLTTLQVNIFLHLPLTFSLGKCDMFPFSRHSSVLSVSTRYIKVTRVFKESGAKQNSTTFAIAKSPQSYKFGCCWTQRIFTCQTADLRQLNFFNYFLNPQIST